MRDRHGGRRWLRAIAGLAVVMVVGAATAGPAAAIGSPPDPIPSRLPSGDATPEFQMRRTNTACATAGVMPTSDFTQTPPPLTMMNIARAWTYTRGAGVRVAVIDTGVTPQRRLPHLQAGGDFVSRGGSGLVDCDAHGTMVAGIIAGAPGPADAFSGVAPDATILSIRQTSDTYSVELPEGSDTSDPRLSKNAIDARSLARAVVRAANLGARVINISVTECLATTASTDLTSLSTALWYAAVIKDAVVVSAAGNTGDREGCQDNPDVDPSRPQDSRNWAGVQTVSVPSLFDKYVVSVGFTSSDGQPSPNTLAGPWVSVGAPGTGVVSLGPAGTVIDGVTSQQGGLVPLAGSSYAAAYVSGVSALLRAYYPQLTRTQIVSRLLGTAHAPARGVNNVIGYGIVDPVAALSNTQPRAVRADNTAPQRLDLPPPQPAPDRRPEVTALIGAGVVVASAVITVVVLAIRRRGEQGGSR